jgi:trans-2-enoyl-CoA reductase
MKQVFCIQPQSDPIQAVAVHDVEPPICPAAGIVVAVKARPINPADLLLLNGRHVFQPELPAPVGIEGAGTVLQAGPDSRYQVGDQVAIPFGGTWREQMALGDDDVLPLSATVPLEQAAMISVNPFTAAGLLEGLQPGDCLALNAPNSAISRLILNLCRDRGLQAVAITRDAASQERAIARGAVAAVSDGPELGERVRKVAPGAVVRVLDAVAGEACTRLFDVVADGGELIVYGLLGGDTVQLPAAGVVFRDVVVKGYSRLRCLRALTPARRAELTHELLHMAAQGLLASEIEACYPLTEVQAALAHHLKPGRSGKILLTS